MVAHLSTSQESLRRERTSEEYSQRQKYVASRCCSYIRLAFPHSLSATATASLLDSKKRSNHDLVDIRLDVSTEITSSEQLE